MAQQAEQSLYITISPDGLKMGTCEHCVIQEPGRPERAWNPNGDTELDFDRNGYIKTMRELGVVIERDLIGGGGCRQRHVGTTAGGGAVVVAGHDDGRAGANRARVIVTVHLQPGRIDLIHDSQDAFRRAPQTPMVS